MGVGAERIVEPLVGQVEHGPGTNQEAQQEEDPAECLVSGKGKNSTHDEHSQNDPKDPSTGLPQFSPVSLIHHDFNLRWLRAVLKCNADADL